LRFYAKAKKNTYALIAVSMPGPMPLLQEVAKTFSAHRQNTLDESIIGFDLSRVSPNELYKLESAFGPHG
jgi:hypothetical protein